MPTPDNLDPSAFFLEGGPVGALLIHGFTGAPVEMRLIGDYLHDRGVTVSAPLLPGHGTDIDDLNQRKSEEWLRAVEDSLANLKTKTSHTFVVGYSFGTILGLHLAAAAHDLAGLVVIAPPIALDGWRRWAVRAASRFIDRIPSINNPHFITPEAVSRLWHYDAYPAKATSEVLALVHTVRQALPEVACPLLVVYSVGDTQAGSKGAIELFEMVGSADKEVMELQHSGHAITVDAEWDVVAERIYQFVSRRSVDLS